MILREVKHPATPKRASLQLQEICRKIKKLETSRHLFRIWPNLRTASYHLVDFLTVYWPDPLYRDETLLSASLSCALQHAEVYMAKGTDEVEMQKAFITSITEELILLLECSLMIRFKSAWKPYEINQDFLGNILRQHTVTALLWEQTAKQSTQDSKIIVASRVFTLAELRLAGVIAHD